MKRSGGWIGLGLLVAPVLLATEMLAQNPPVPSGPPQNAAAQNAPTQNVPPPSRAPQTGTLAVTPIGLPTAVGTTAPPPRKVQPTQKEKEKEKEKPKELVLPPLPSGPLSQLPMDQIPASPAKVSFRDGLLTISAENSTLGEILRDVRKLTGASIEIPQGSGANERVVAHFGPGAPRDVLVGLLNGSSFNYVMIGSNSDSSAVSTVILTAKSGSGDQQAGMSFGNDPSQNNQNNQPPNNGMPMPPGGRFARAVALNQNPVAQRGQPDAESDDSKDDDQDTPDDTATAEDQTPAQSPTGPPGQPDANAAEPSPSTSTPDPNQPNAGPKTPEQIMDMLRRQQQPGAAVVPPPQPAQPPQQQ